MDVITRNADRLSELVETLLEIGKIRNADGVSTPQEVSLKDAISDVVHNVRVLADRRGIALVATECDGAVVADAGDVNRILTNLLSNAVKFTPEHGTVSVRTEHGADTVRVVVADTGPGMSADAITHAFDRFYRAPEAERQSVPGTGLGLAIVAELVSRNDGTITLTSPSEGGLVATVEFPQYRASTTP